jgi:AhpD family alkylhydroperoxidase
MTRIAPLPARDAGWFTRFTYWYAGRLYGRLPGALGVLARNAGILRAVAGYEFWSARASKVDKKLKLLAEVRVATLVGCRYCLDIGSAIARGAGVSERQLLELDEYATSPAFGPEERAALEYATCLSSVPCDVPDELFARLRGYFDEAQLVELTAAITWENQRARFNHALRIPPDGFSVGAVCAVPAARLGAGAAVSHSH